MGLINKVKELKLKQENIHKFIEILEFIDNPSNKNQTLTIGQDKPSKKKQSPKIE